MLRRFEDLALGMNDLPQQPTGIPAPLGLIEPHAGLLSGIRTWTRTMVPNCRAISRAMRRPHSRALQTFQQPIITISRGLGPTPIAFRWRTRITSGRPTRTA